MGRVRDQHPVGIEDRAGEVQPLLDVDRVRGVLQRQAHLLGDRHEPVVEHLQHDRIAVGPDRGFAGEVHHPFHDEIAGRGHARAPAGLHHGGRGGLENDGGPVHDIARRERVAPQDRCFVLRAFEVDGDVRHRRRRPLAIDATGCDGMRYILHRPDGLHGGRLDDEGLLRHHESVAAPVGVLEAVLHLRRGARLDEVRRVGALVAHVGAAMDGDAFRRDALVHELRARFTGKRVQRLAERRGTVDIEPDLDRAIA